MPRDPGVIFVTVGTLFPFDRLVRAVDAAAGAGLIQGPAFAQVGQGGYRPRHMAWAETLDRSVFEEYVDGARALVGHAGAGTIVMALQRRKPLLVMPRLRERGEHVNDHQVGTARRFAALGQVLVAYDETEIPGRLRDLEAFVPAPRRTGPAGVVAAVKWFLDRVAASRSGPSTGSGPPRAKSRGTREGAW